MQHAANTLLTPADHAAIRTWRRRTPIITCAIVFALLATDKIARTILSLPVSQQVSAQAQAGFLMD